MNKGDSGGPLLLNGVQIGVTSYGSGNSCAIDSNGNGNLFTRVASYMDWIEAKISAPAPIPIQNPIKNFIDTLNIFLQSYLGISLPG